MTGIETLQTIDETWKLVQRHHAGIILLVWWNACLTLAVIILAVRSRRRSN